MVILIQGRIKLTLRNIRSYLRDHIYQRVVKHALTTLAVLNTFVNTQQRCVRAGKMHFHADFVDKSTSR